MTVQTIQTPKGTSYRVQVMRNGKRISKTFQSKKEAKAFEARMLVDDDLITNLTDSILTTYTFDRCALEYLDQYAGKDPCVNQRVGYWREQFGQLTLNKVRAIDVQACLNAMAKAGKAPSTLNRYRTTLSAVFEWINDQYQIKINPAREVKARKEGAGRSRFLSPAEVERLLKTCRASQWPRLYLLVLMAVTTGARRSELLNLTWDRVDLKACQARLDTTKNGHPRILPLTDAVVTELQRFREVGTGFVFPHVNPHKSGPWTTFDGTWYIARDAAGLGADVCFHTLRHTTASLMASNNTSLLVIADVMGHKSMSMVQRYAHLATGAKSEVINQHFAAFGTK